MAEPMYVNRKSAAVLCGCSTQTLRRYDHDGKLPNRRVGDDGSVLYTVADLVAAGLLDPTGTAVPLDLTDRTTPGGGPDARAHLAVAETRIAELTAQLARAEDEIGFLRRLVLRREAVA